MATQQQDPRTEERLTRLEARSEEQALHVAGLVSAVQGQTKRIDDLAAEVRSLRGSVDSLRNVIIVVALGAVITFVVSAFM